MTDHPKPPASSRARLGSQPGTTTPGAQAYGLGAEESGAEPSALVREHKALVEELGHGTAPETDLGEPAEPTPDPPEKT